MSRAEFSSHLAARAARAHITLPASQMERLVDYFELLRTWNRKINLTALPLEPASDEAVDRLFVEPLAAARVLGPDGPFSQSAFSSWLDVGSGGGSPAVPMKVALPAFSLTMIESKSRKAAFLREVVRQGVVAAEVVNARLEEARAQIVASLVTIRAVRIDSRLLLSLSESMNESGHLAIFQVNPEPVPFPGFEIRRTEHLLPDQPAWLHVYARMFHVEHHAAGRWER